MRILNRITLPSITGRKMNIFVAIGGGLLLFIVLSLLLLAPIRRSIAVKKDEWKKMEARLIESRTKLEYSSRIDKAALEADLKVLRRRLPARSAVSPVLDELTKRGRELNIEFISITPQEEKVISTPEGASGALKYKILPIEINMRSAYRSLGEYLGIVERLETGFATVGEFQARKDEKAPPKLNVRLEIYTYIIDSENTSGTEDQSGQR